MTRLERVAAALDAAKERRTAALRAFFELRPSVELQRAVEAVACASYDVGAESMHRIVLETSRIALETRRKG